MATTADAVQDGAQPVPDIYQCTVQTPNQGRQYITFDDPEVTIDVLLELCGETDLDENDEYGMLVTMPDPHHAQNVKYFVPTDEDIDLSENQVQYVEVIQVWDDATLERERIAAQERADAADTTEAAAQDRKDAEQTARDESEAANAKSEAELEADRKKAAEEAAVGDATE